MKVLLNRNLACKIIAASHHGNPIPALSFRLIQGKIGALEHGSNA